VPNSTKWKIISNSSIEKKLLSNYNNSNNRNKPEREEYQIIKNTRERLGARNRPRDDLVIDITKHRL